MRIEGPIHFLQQSEPRIYVTQPEDTLNSVALNFTLPAEFLARANNLPVEAKLEAGMELIIPTDQRPEAMPTDQRPERAMPTDQHETFFPGILGGIDDLVSGI